MHTHALGGRQSGMRDRGERRVHFRCKKGAYLIVEAHFQFTRFQNGHWTKYTAELNNLTIF